MNKQLLNGPSPRVTDGLCPITRPCTAPRVSSVYREGKGDKRTITGDEELLLDLLLGALEELKLSLIEPLGLLDRDGNIYIFTNWVLEATYSLSAFIHCVREGQEVITRHTLPQEAHSYLKVNWEGKTNEIMESITSWKEELGSKEEFGHYPPGGKAKGARMLDLCRVKARKVQTLFRAWRSHQEEVGGHAEELDQTLVFLNRLSSYYEWAARKEAQFNGVGVELWESKMPSFPIELIS
jgi:hypothetical protein